MAAIIRASFNKFHDFLDNYQDKRVEKWLFMSSPFYPIAISLFYVYCVTKLGPRIMKYRKPYKLRKTLVVYNFLQVIFSSYLFYEFAMSGWLTKDYSFTCQPIDHSDNPKALRMANVSWWYFIAKFTEFADTIFFILRKKFTQVSTLHVIHHGIMPISVWFGVKMVPGGHGTFLGLANSFIHIIMYAYYMLSALGPQAVGFLGWKKYLTLLQMMQFIAIMMHAFQLLFIDCDFPKAFAWSIGLHAIMFFCLFKNFYEQSYNENRKHIE